MELERQQLRKQPRKRRSRKVSLRRSCRLAVFRSSSRVKEDCFQTRNTFTTLSCRSTLCQLMLTAKWVERTVWLFCVRVLTHCIVSGSGIWVTASCRVSWTSLLAWIQNHFVSGHSGLSHSSRLHHARERTKLHRRGRAAACSAVQTLHVPPTIEEDGERWEKRPKLKRQDNAENQIYKELLLFNFNSIRYNPIV